MYKTYGHGFFKILLALVTEYQNLKNTIYITLRETFNFNDKGIVT